VDQVAESGDRLQSNLPVQPYEEYTIKELQSLLWSIISDRLVGPMCSAYAERPKRHFFFSLSRYLFLFNSGKDDFFVSCHITTINSFSLELTVPAWHLNFIIDCDGSDQRNVQWRLLFNSSQGGYEMTADRNALVSLIGLCANAVLDEYYD
jgi:hypothetical protein